MTTPSQGVPVQPSSTHPKAPAVIGGVLEGSRRDVWTLSAIAARAPLASASVYRRVPGGPANASRRSMTTMTVGEYRDRLLAGDGSVEGTSLRCVVGESPVLAAATSPCPWPAAAGRRFVCELFSGVDYSTAGHVHPRAHALLCQIEGEKDVVLYPPGAFRDVYPNSIFDEEPTVSRADFVKPDVARFPRLASARRWVVRLLPGAALFIPVGYWHAVAGTGLSTSLSYFWGARLREQSSVAAMLRNDVGALIGRTLRPLWAAWPRRSA